MIVYVAFNYTEYQPWNCFFAGTFIDQGEAPSFYFQKYPEDNPVLGFFTWRWILPLGFDHMFSSPVFLGTLTLLGASLMACTYTTQIPLVKVARRFVCILNHVIIAVSCIFLLLNMI